MKPVENVAASLSRWCMKRDWDSLLMLFTSPGTTAAETDRHFRRWVEEVEHAVGTAGFRWARLLPRNEGEAPAAFFVLLAGIRSDDLSPWGRRWSVIGGNQGGRRGPVFSSGQQPKRMRSMMRMLLDQAEDFDVEVRIGPKAIDRGRAVVDKDRTSSSASTSGESSDTDKAPATVSRRQKRERIRWQPVL
jgi:hypothetical protein